MANARNVSFPISVRWSIYIINSVDKPNFRETFKSVEECVPGYWRKGVSICSHLDDIHWNLRQLKYFVNHKLGLRRRGSNHQLSTFAGQLLWNSTVQYRAEKHKAWISGNLSFIVYAFMTTTSLMFVKEIKNAPSALLSYISTREFLRTREKCGEARAEGSRGTIFLFLL